MLRVEVHPDLLRWARLRAGLDPQRLAKRFPGLADWEARRKRPTLRQLEEFAHAARAPLGYFFLDAPPVETLPIADFRTPANAETTASVDLLDTIRICLERQEFFRDYALAHDLPRPVLVNSCTVETPIEKAAEMLGRALLFGVEEREHTWEDALRQFGDNAERAGILVMMSGFVGNDTHRRLRVEEFRGFALADDIAPLVFVNTTDGVPARMFTLAHEIAHLCLGTSALSNVGADLRDAVPKAEVWCNRVAAEFLVPRAVLRRELQPGEPLQDALRRIAGLFKVSRLVALRGLLDVGYLTRPAFVAAYDEEVKRIAEDVRKQRDVQTEREGGPNFYQVFPPRVSKRFVRALLADTLSGATLYRDALHLLGLKKTTTLHELANRLGVV